MNRAFRIELRRSNALPLAAVLLAFVVLVDTLLNSGNWGGNWMKLATDRRGALLVTIVFAIGAGALQAGLDHRRGVVELLTSTPRPRRVRVLPVALALAIASAGAYLLTFALGGIWVAPYATYANPIAIAGVVGVGAVTMVTAAWLGLLIGHLLPSRLTAPIASVLALLLMAVGSDYLGRLGNGAALRLLLPDLSPPIEGAATIPVRLSALQAVWLLAVGLSALGAFLATRRRFQILAVLPAALALILVAPRLPHGSDYSAAFTIDPKAAALVCATGTPRVCVTRADAAQLPQVTPLARAALTALARLPHPPTAVIQYVAPESSRFEQPPARADTVWMDLSPYGTDNQGRMDPEGTQVLTVQLLDGVGASRYRCADTSGGFDTGSAANEISTAWLLGHPPTPASWLSAQEQEWTRTGWTALTSVPAAEQRERVSAIRQALLTCKGDAYTILTKGTAR